MNKYKMIEKIGEGSFGEVYRGKYIRTSEDVAIKRIEKTKGSFKHEIKICNYLQGKAGIYNIKWYGSDIDYHYVIFDLLGKSLTEYLVQTSNHTFTPGTVKYVGKQMIDIIEYIHTKGIVHRDIKLDNFMMGINDPYQVYLIDYGLSKAYINNHNHQDETDNNEPIGTYNYMSINIHNGIKYSRRDDMISIVYILCHLLEGILPWIYEETCTDIISKKILFIPKHSSLRRLHQLVTKLRYKETPAYFIYKKHLEKIAEYEELEWLNKDSYTILT
jgi:serine/threonine protein kinase